MRQSRKSSSTCLSFDIEQLFWKEYEMTDRKLLVEDKEGVETILLALEGIGPEIPDKLVIKALSRSLWHILDYIIWRIR